jgi:hypothetical protein
MQENILKVMLKSKQTVFSFKELLLLLKTDDVTALKSTLNYYIKNGELYHIRRGLYAKDANYDRLELATKIFTPSYVSFETILFSAGIIFQYYSAIFVASYQSREINCDGQAFVFKRIKPTILTNSKGVENNVAIPERGLLDLLYLNKEYHFDNLEPIDWDRVYEILPIYKNKSLEQRLIALPNSWKKSIEE